MLKNRKIIKNIAVIGVFGALAIILYCVPGLQFALPFTPPFLKIHLEEIPILFVSFAYGPLSSFCIIVLKSLIKLITDIAETGGVGVLADFIYSLAFIIPAGLIYKYKKSFGFGILGIVVGTTFALVLSSLIAPFTIFPLFGLYFGAPNYNSAVVQIGSMFGALDPSITRCTDFKVSYEFLLPFNLVKFAIINSTVLLVYKPLHSIISK